MRVFSQKRYGISPEQMIGSSIKTAFEMRDGYPVLMRLSQRKFVDDKAGRRVGIRQQKDDWRRVFLVASR